MNIRLRLLGILLLVFMAVFFDLIMVDSVLKCYQELVKNMNFLQKNVFMENS